MAAFLRFILSQARPVMVKLPLQTGLSWDTPVCNGTLVREGQREITRGEFTGGGTDTRDGPPQGELLRIDLT